MKGWVGEAIVGLIAFIAFATVIGLVLVLFVAPSNSTGLPEAFNYFAGVFSRG